MGVVRVMGAQEQNSVSQSLLTKLGEQRGGVAGGWSPRPGGGRGHRLTADAPIGLLCAGTAPRA